MCASGFFILNHPPNKIVFLNVKERKNDFIFFLNSHSDYGYTLLLYILQHQQQAGWCAGDG